MEGYNSGTASWKSWIGQGMGKEWGSSCPFQVQHSSQISTCSPTGKLSELVLLGFYGGFITQAWLIKSLANLQPLTPPPVTERSNLLFTWLVQLVTSTPSHLYRISESHLINISSVAVERGFLWITRHPFHHYGFEGISGTEDKRLNIITKDAPIALIA